MSSLAIVIVTGIILLLVVISLLFRMSAKTKTLKELKEKEKRFARKNFKTSKTRHLLHNEVEEHYIDSSKFKKKTTT